MYCPKCGLKETIITNTFRDIKYIVCERCEEEFSIKSHTKLSQEELTKLRLNLQDDYEKQAKGSLVENFKDIFEKIDIKL